MLRDIKSALQKQSNSYDAKAMRLVYALPKSELWILGTEKGEIAEVIFYPNF